MADTRTELAHIQRQLDWWQDEHGEVVAWYEFDSKASHYHDVFNVQGKVFRPPIIVPVLWVTPIEDVQETVAEGRRNVGTLQLAISMWSFRRTGVSDPYDYERHQNDLLVYQGEYYSVGEYTLLGRLWREDVILAVNGIRVYPEEELTGSEIPDAEFVAEASRPDLGNTDDQTFLHYPPPAPQAVATGTISGGFSWSLG
jgi:hypothetical protein